MCAQCWLFLLLLLLHSQVFTHKISFRSVWINLFVFCLVFHFAHSFKIPLSLFFFLFVVFCAFVVHNCFTDSLTCGKSFWCLVFGNTHVNVFVMFSFCVHFLAFWIIFQLRSPLLLLPYHWSAHYFWAIIGIYFQKRGLAKGQKWKFIFGMNFNNSCYFYQKFMFVHANSGLILMTYLKYRRKMS